MGCSFSTHMESLEAGNFVDFDLANVVIKVTQIYLMLLVSEDSSNNIITIISDLHQQNKICFQKQIF